MRKPRSPYLKLARLIEDEGFEQNHVTFHGCVSPLFSPG